MALNKLFSACAILCFAQFVSAATSPTAKPISFGDRPITVSGILMSYDNHFIVVKNNGKKIKLPKSAIHGTAGYTVGKAYVTAQITPNEIYSLNCKKSDDSKHLICNN